MPAACLRPWLICYDIADPRRLFKVHRYLKHSAIPVQYSVFLAHLTAARLRDVLAGIRERIDEREDDVRAYPIMAAPPVESVGRQILPEGVMLLGESRRARTAA